MTEERLERYIGLKQEIASLEALIRKEVTKGPDMVTEVVQSAATFPYSLHAQSVSGLNIYQLETDVAKLVEKWEKKKNDASKEILELEEYISSVDDPKIRTIMRDRYIEDVGWRKIGFKFGWTDETTPHKKVQKFLRDSGFSGLDDL